jgi:hypothetical protein
MPLYFTACENCGSGPGALEVKTASISLEDIFGDLFAMIVNSNSDTAVEMSDNFRSQWSLKMRFVKLYISDEMAAACSAKVRLSPGRRA